MSDMQKDEQKKNSALDTPVAVMIAGTAIVAIKCISIVLLLEALGFSGLWELVNISAQTWAATFIFLAGLLVLCLQIGCGFAVIGGYNRGRWGYVACQFMIAGYLLLVTTGNFWPVIFIVDGDTSGQILPRLLMQKIPDVVILLLLFIPTTSRRFFAQSR